MGGKPLWRSRQTLPTKHTTAWQAARSARRSRFCYNSQERKGGAIAMKPQGTDRATNHTVVTGTMAWPTIKNTRVTLFDLMDHLKQGLPPQFVAYWYQLTAEEMDEVMHFLTAHEAAIAQAYAAANTRAAEARRYWEARNREVL